MTNVRQTKPFSLSHICRSFVQESMKSNEEINAARDNLLKFVDEFCRQNRCETLGAALPFPVLAVVYIDCLKWILGESNSTFDFL